MALLKTRFDPKQFDFSDKPLSPVWFLISIGLSAFTLFCLCILTIAVWRLAIRPLPRLVHKSDGNTLSVKVAPYDHREDQAIKKFVDQTFKMMFTWSPQYETVDPNTGEKVPQIDQGVQIDSNLTVTTPAYEAALALSEDLRLPLLKKLSQLVPFSFNSNQTTTYLKIDYLSEPKFLARDRWQLDLVANWIIRTGRTEKTIPFNKTVTVRAIDSYGLPNEEMASPFEVSASRIRASGLQIIDIQDFHP